MKLFKTFIIIILGLFLVYFLQENSALVNLNLIFKTFNNVSVSMIIFGSLAGGILLGYTFAIFSILSAKSDIRRLNNKNKQLSDELDDLRNVAIEDGVYDDEYGDE